MEMVYDAHRDVRSRRFNKRVDLGASVNGLFNKLQLEEYFQQGRLGKETWTVDEQKERKPGGRKKD